VIGIRIRAILCVEFTGRRRLPPPPAVHLNPLLGAAADLLLDRAGHQRGRLSPRGASGAWGDDLTEAPLKRRAALKRRPP